MGVRGGLEMMTVGFVSKRASSLRETFKSELVRLSSPPSKDSMETLLPKLEPMAPYSKLAIRNEFWDQPCVRTCAAKGAKPFRPSRVSARR